MTLTPRSQAVQAQSTAQPTVESTVQPSVQPTTQPTVQSAPHCPELLAPAGNWQCAKAAIENGADAIYFGLERFNARMRAENFVEADLPKLMDFLHRRGVKGYVTLNTLIFPAELAEAERYLRGIIAAGVDAAIVQDVGICRLIRHLSPDFPIHASTQMTITSAAGVEFAQTLGCQLVVLARECSLSEIDKIQQQLDRQGMALPLEVFIHGALCVAYSGQCLTSESLGGRSANRGECAQACRMPYELISDGAVVDLGDRHYLLSPQDLSGLDVLPQLVQSGLTCLKIEGRLKSPEYVANVTRVYRQALDRVMVQVGDQARDQGGEQDRDQGRDQGRDQSADQTPTRGKRDRPAAFTPAPYSTPAERYNLEMAFSRGLYTGWFQGINNQELVHARFGKKRGVYLGQVRRIHNEQVSILLEAPVKAGDGVVFDSGHPEAPEEGGRIFGVERHGQEMILAFGRHSINWKRVHVGDRLWKTSDPELDRHLRQTYAGEHPQFHRPIDIEVHGQVGQPLTAIARDGEGHTVQVESAMPLVAATHKPLTPERLREQLGRLGNTPFRLETLTLDLSGDVLLPLSELNRLRRELVTQLEELRSRPQRWQLQAEARYTDLLPALLSPEGASLERANPELSSPELIVLVRTLEQLQMALEQGIHTLYCEFEDPRQYAEAVRQVRMFGTQGAIAPSDGMAPVRPTIWVAPPRITKPGETWILKQVRASEADGYLVRNYDHLAFFAGDRCIGDFSLNVANPLTADYFKQQFGLERLTASYDLNIQQLKDLLTTTPPDWFEVTIHQHMPMFHMEHCVFCAFLSAGTDYTNCGRPCETHQVTLRDRVGTEHVLKADAGCRNTVYNGTAQTGAEYVQHLVGWRVRHLRIEFVNEAPAQVAQTIQRYRQLLDGTITGAQLWRDLQLHSQLNNQLGVTRGPMISQ